MAEPGEAGGYSRWHSPVPYLFGGLVAMLALIAVALFLLACSYWNLSRRPERDVSSGEAEGKMGVEAEAARQACYEEKVVVIMAGEEKPTYLATPITSRASSSSSSSSSFGDGGATKEKEKDCRGMEQRQS